ncbi:uncharacterized protein cubi_01380 [Cryptosporidium ubiquitum]|uniref:Clathrin/coatomer adaptor adaptin-like N-terminal domain-containing protein n=1 Tax=Cryptosporidium ubiquitum TaxID=857276 RepID=A0A1J4MDJ0_9CRYT|nr:uncharacterized protein cubi_01380 [Cryptosporidium ubiquitum]OII72047.1 hypothetical protein cubi_01380 [Cryptosporidium ubiquitum]
MQYVDSFSSRQLFDLVKSIGECRSKHEEDNIIINELSILKIKLIQNSLSSNKLREYMIRAIYIEMLGHDASFAYIHAIKMTNDKNAFVKRIGYLACSIFLNRKHELLVLLVNTLQRDLTSRNQLDVASALSCLPYLLNYEIFSSIENSILMLLSHQIAGIRRKAYLTLLCVLEIKPTIFEENTDILMRGLSDSDISVKNSVLYLVDKISSFNPKLCIPLIPHLTLIMKQILENNISKEYDYYFVSAPWTQINILQTLSKIASFEKKTNQIYEILYSTIKKVEYSISMPSYNGKSMIYPININNRNTNNTANISYAILDSCVGAISSIHPNNELLGQVEEIISRFLNSDLNYLKYIGIKCLSKIAIIDPSYAIPHQIIVVDCLEDKDETIRRCTLELLCNMSNPQNIQVVISKLINNLKIATDCHFCEELVKNILLLSEKFAPSYNWYLNTMVKILELSGEFVGKDKVNNIAQIIAEGPTGNDDSDQEFRVHTSNLFLELLKEKADKLPEILYNLGIWILGEYGSCTANDGSEIITLKTLYEVTILLYDIFKKLKINMNVCQSNNAQSKRSFADIATFMRINTKPETISMIISALLKCYSYTIMSSKKFNNSENYLSIENERNKEYIFYLEKMNEIYNQIFKDSVSIPTNIINQRIKEFTSIIQLSNRINCELTNYLGNEYFELLSYILPFDASCEEIYVDRKLSFLDKLVTEYKLSEKYTNKKNSINPYLPVEDINLNRALKNVEIEAIKEIDLIEVFPDIETNLRYEITQNNNIGIISDCKTQNSIDSFTETNIKKSHDLNVTKTVRNLNLGLQVDQINTELFNKGYNAKKWGPEGFGKHEKIQTKGKELVSKLANDPKNIKIQSEKNCENFLSKQREAVALFNGISNSQKKK